MLDVTQGEYTRSKRGRRGTGCWSSECWRGYAMGERPEERELYRSEVGNTFETRCWRLPNTATRQHLGDRLQAPCAMLRSCHVQHPRFWCRCRQSVVLSVRRPTNSDPCRLCRVVCRKPRRITCISSVYARHSRGHFLKPAPQMQAERQSWAVWSERIPIRKAQL